MSQGGKRAGAGRKSCPATATHPVRCTDEGWEWLQSQALGKGHTSVGKWADAAGRNELRDLVIPGRKNGRSYRVNQRLKSFKSLRIGLMESN